MIYTATYSAGPHVTKQVTLEARSIRHAMELLLETEPPALEDDAVSIVEQEDNVKAA
jgi:hypothetical protein